jgi:hypothetical protein
MLRILALVGLLFSTLPVGAQNLEQARFLTAVSAWLKGDDEKSLTTLAKLARDGHSDARLLLAQIEIADRGPSRYRQGLSRRETKDLFRKTSFGEPFAQSWLSIEAMDGNRLAQLLLQARDTRVRPELITELHVLGEHQATGRPIRILALYGTDQQRMDLLNSDDLLPELTPFLTYLNDDPRPQADGLAALAYILDQDGASLDPADPDTRAMAGLLALGFGFGSLDPDNRWYQDVSDWVLSSDVTKPLVGACGTGCTEQETRACAMTLLALTGGYYEATRLDTPVESFIPQGRFLASPRARIMALRRAALNRAETNSLLASIGQIAEHSACTAEMVKRERKP